ncbi:MAG: LytR family transcriptional regulator, partial [Gammaproteobacteria bacterium]|nr:LytR family transcriptional regulator [Gammaproteobacteria bacterium]
PFEINAPLQPENGPPPHSWDGTSRINVLLLGADSREWEANFGPPRTDTMILLTLDPQSQTGGMLSLPRDIWLEIPGYGYGKINQAYFFGEADQI